MARLNRNVQAEQLDHLPDDHPWARRGRRDLLLINALMGNWRWMARELWARLRENDGVLELGAGDGAFGRWMHDRARSRGRSLRWHGLDFARRPAAWPRGWEWTQADVLADDGFARCDVVVVNLMLHHFQAGQLGSLGARMGATARVILASEPARGRLHLWQAHALTLAGVSRVTRHDAPVSVRAGFRGNELPEWLGLDPAEWSIAIDHAWKGAYRMVAQRARG
ncbi:MAG: hypothetical protein ACREIA_12555 [Opitutaceae bacterium]